MGKSEQTMTVAGVGPRWVLLSLAMSVPFVAIRFLWPEAVSLSFLPRPLVLAVGIALLAVGIPFCLLGVIRLARGFPRGELFTGGVYGWCRHPIYASWIVFNVPGIVLLADSWIGLLAPLLMYLALRWLVREEGQWLERTFGDEYRAYRDRVPAVLPIPPALQRRRS